MQAYPELHSFPKNKYLTVKDAKQSKGLDQLFHLPLSAEAHSQINDFLRILEDCANLGTQDIWGYIWGTNKYAASKGYRQLSGTRVPHILFPKLWKSAVQNKHKVFFWLLLKDRIGTRGLLQRRNM